jgi:von Willebrand factor type A domain/Aerotolerance regulator N-terminal
VTLLAPLALGALLVPLAIYLVHWLFGTRRRLRVPAIFLWADLPQASAGRSKRRWPPITLLLLLQLLAATLATFALARPATPSEAPRHLALILDASASMQATDVAPTRFDAARARALERVNALRLTDMVSLIRAGREASLVASGLPDTARSALAAIQPGLSGAAMREALALASSQLAATPERRGQIVILTDAAWPALDPVGPLAAPVEVVAVGGGSDNQAVSSVSVRMDPSGRSQTAFVEVANQADRAVRVPMRLTADGAPIDERQVDIPSRTHARLSIPLPADARRVAVRLVGRDSLALDDTVETIAPGGPPRDVLLLGRGTDGLRRALESVPSLRVRTADFPARPELTVLEGSLPPQLPAGPLLLVDPPASSGRLLGVGLGSGARVQQTHPLLQGLDLGTLQNETPEISGVPGWARVVLGNLQGPLIMEGRLEGRPTVALTFDPRISGLEKSLAFPLLISNATTFLLNQADTPPAIGEPFDPAESDIAPRPIPSFMSSVVPVVASDGANAHPELAEQWPWLLSGVLVVLGAEWLIFARRG